MPCDAESDCGGAVCSPLPGFENLGGQDATLRSYLSDLNLFDLGLDRLSCVVQGGGIDFIHELKDFLLANFFEQCAQGSNSLGQACSGHVTLLEALVLNSGPRCCRDPVLIRHASGGCSGAL